jgi:hypothetical protein
MTYRRLDDGAAMDLSESLEIERLYGAKALEEWRLVLRQFEFEEGFAFIVLTVPDKTAARLCRNDLQAVLAARKLTLAPITPADPAELAILATTLLGIPDDHAIGALWVEAVSSEHAVDYHNWETAWGQALGSLNQQRNPLRRRSAPLLLVGAPWLAPMVRQRAPDLWSVRALVARIDPVTLDHAPGVVGGERTAQTHGARNQISGREAGSVPDPELGRRAVERLRGITVETCACGRSGENGPGSGGSR